MYICIYIYIYIHTYIHIHIYGYMYMYQTLPDNQRKKDRKTRLMSYRVTVSLCRESSSGVQRELLERALPLAETASSESRSSECVAVGCTCEVAVCRCNMLQRVAFSPCCAARSPELPLVEFF